MPDNSKTVALKVRAISQAFGAKKILHDVNLRIYRGDITALVGPSGCGKSTLLNAIVGTLKPSSGSIMVLRGNTYCEIDGPGRDRGIVYQRYALLPFLTAVQNVAYGLMADETSLFYRLCLYPLWHKLRRRHLQKAEALLQKVGLEKALHLYPHEMSGGMCQRVAIAQAIIMNPQILLLDEPFGALDEATREDLQWMMRGLSTENRKAAAAGTVPPHTVIIVTHEINEALFVSDRLIGISQYWNWKAAGFQECPGATIVYDQPSPVFELKENRDLELFKDQREKILSSVFDASVCQPRWDFIQESERSPATGQEGDTNG